ncbi:putative s-receptor kinase [Tripterygium wilfordii]|uniref:Putative s-receptor kinase n=1 Tax=Tripterygium wilfordii TaxID=458696 RepID=A0A7J7CEK1_TRIWF|nr:putative s-receptor kinase [Tripterygium wilfordii]
MKRQANTIEPIKSLSTAFGFGMIKAFLAPKYISLKVEWRNQMKCSGSRMELTLTQPDDWHLHLRDGDLLQAVVPHSATHFGRAIVMPNLKSPITTTVAALNYRELILKALPSNSYFNPLMTLYLTDTTSPDEIKLARKSGAIFAVKLYPFGATTNSQNGVTDLFGKCLPVLVEMYIEEMDIKSKKPLFYQCLVLLLHLSFKIRSSEGSDTIFSGQSLSGNQTITSAGGDFKLGFFTPGKSRNYHVGIWYAKLPDQTVVWVANRQQPVSNLTSSALKLLENGNLVLLNQSKAIMWSTGSKSVAPNSTVTMLLDSGNLVIRDALDSSKILWQSFDYPTDHWLPGGKLGYNNLTKEKQKISPWRSSQNPAPALFSLEVEQDGTSHLLLWNESERYWTSGEWTGKVFTEVPELQLNYYVRNMTYISNENESYYTYSAAIPSAYTRFLLDVTGQLKQFVWQKSSNRWDLFWTRPPQECEVYAFCGPFSICNQDKAPLCFCPEGFETEAPGDWEMGDHTGGCTRRTPLQCDNGGTDTFLVIPNMRFPSNPESSTAKTIEECEKECSTNCSCNAFAYDSGCSIWKGDVFNLQQLPSDDKAGREFHIRISASDLRGNGVKETRGRRNSEQLDDEMDIYFPFRVANIIDKGEDVVQLLDDRLDGNTNIEELNKACRVACWCIQENEKDRPSMGQVVQLLEGLSEVGAPPIPRFLLGLSENPDEAIRFQETSSSSTLTGSN